MRTRSKLAKAQPSHPILSKREGQSRETKQHGTRHRDILPLPYRSRLFCYGGVTGQRKFKRAASYKHPMHIVLKSRLARGPWSLLHKKHHQWVRGLILKKARLRKIKIEKLVNGGHHLHIVLRLTRKNRDDLGHFLRTISALIARRMMGTEKGRPGRRAWRSRKADKSLKGIGFWDARPFSRILDKVERETHFTIKKIADGLAPAIGFDLKIKYDSS